MTDLIDPRIMNKKKLFGIKLRLWRKKKNLKSEDVAEKIGIRLETYSRWENGKNSPSKHYMEPLSELFPELIRNPVKT